jgi:protein subunit release factor B
MDRNVATAYGWNDLELEHGFHDVSYLPKGDRRRFSISERARREIVSRLLKLNLERHQKELSGSTAQGNSQSRTRSRRKSTFDQDQGDLLIDFVTDGKQLAKGL